MGLDNSVSFTSIAIVQAPPFIPSEALVDTLSASARNTQRVRARLCWVHGRYADPGMPTDRCVMFAVLLCRLCAHLALGESAQTLLGDGKRGAHVVSFQERRLQKARCEARGVKREV